jgi:hypothetical protein
MKLHIGESGSTTGLAELVGEAGKYPGRNGWWCCKHGVSPFYGFLGSSSLTGDNGIH